MMIQHCLRSWEESELPIGHGPSPVMVDGTEEQRTELSEQATLPQKSKKDMPQPDIPVDRRPKVGKSDLTQAAASNKGEEIKGSSSKTRATSAGPKVAKVEDTITPSTSPAMVKANSSSILLST